MESHDMLCAFRDDAVDDVAPYLWKDSEVYRYINDAYFMFVRLTDGIPDGVTAAVTTLTAALDTATTPIHESVMRIRTARNVTNANRPMRIINVQDIDSLTAEDYNLIYSINQIDTSGRPEYMVIGEEEGYVRWINVPDKEYEIQLVVERLPLKPITRSQQRFDGVRTEHHYHLLKWVRHLAYRKQDADAFDLVKSDQERDDFVAYCQLAKAEKGARKHKVRVARYGGI